ncbi:hypothetical protein B0H19DRAFT_1066068 [Mycena capillaripes]|nr:hypothetical protein B0H19DRAFT_1066068 [Mycena capillaripes]
MKVEPPIKTDRLTKILAAALLVLAAEARCATLNTKDFEEATRLQQADVIAAPALSRATQREADPLVVEQNHKIVDSQKSHQSVPALSTQREADQADRDRTIAELSKKSTYGCQMSSPSHFGTLWDGAGS